MINVDLQDQIRNFKSGPEQDLLREHSLSIAIELAGAELAQSREELSGYTYVKEQAPSLDLREMYVLQIGLIRGNIIENCRIRKYIQSKTESLLRNEQISAQCLKHEYRSYLAECVIFYERISHLIVYLSKALGASTHDWNERIRDLLRFFNPQVIDLRNTTAHQHYFTQPSHMKLSMLERRIDDANFEGRRVPSEVAKYQGLYEDAISSQLDWISGTENSFKDYLQQLLDDLRPVMLSESGELHIPDTLPSDLQIEKKLNNKIRRKLDHREIFEG